jgi:Fe-S cluster assembly scaffold IscU
VPAVIEGACIRLKVPITLLIDNDFFDLFNAPTRHHKPSYNHIHNVPKSHRHRARATLPSIQQAVSKRSYHEKVLDHYNNPRNVGSMGKGDSDVGTGLVGAPACGDVMKLQIKVDPKDNTISDVKFKTFGCGSAIASSSYLTELVRGMTLEQAGRIKNTEIAKELCLPPVKRMLSQMYHSTKKSANST